MADFLAGTQRFSVSLHAGYDAVQKSGQKIEFGDMRKVTVSRPDRLRMEGERSDGVKTLTVFNGKEIVLIDETSNVYATAPQPGGLDDTIVYFVKDLGMKLPLAVLLVSQLPAELKARVRSVDYVERTNIDGSPSHHLAARTDMVDFQIWVADGDKPLQTYGVSTGKSSTPTVRGQFQFYLRQPGYNAEGMYFSTYFHGGYAVHGYASVPPTYPASHGCVRVPIPDALHIYNSVALGEDIFVY